MRVVRRGLWGGALCVAAWIAAASAAPLAAQGFDLFGWFRSEPEPVPVADAVPYAVTVETGPSDAAVARLIREASDLVRLRREVPPDGDTLARRAVRDLPAIVDVLWGAGYYAAGVRIEIAGVDIGLGTDRVEAAGRAADRLRGREIIPVRIVADLGPAYVWRRISVIDAASGAPLANREAVAKVIAIEAGGVARTGDLLAARARLVDDYRARGRALARVVRIEPVVIHPERAVDVTMAVSPGPLTPIGHVAVSGTRDVDPEVVRTFIYPRPGDPYSPERIASIRRSVGQIEALGGVRVREATELDANGHLPLTVDVTERLPRVIGGSLRYSTVDGPAARLYWAHRNLFGGAERLRLDASVNYLTDEGPTAQTAGWGDFGGRFTASFLKPGLFGTPNDFLMDGVLLRERTEGYVAESGTVTAAFRHRLNERSYLQGGIEFERGRSEDVLGRIDYTLVGFPLLAVYDSTDNLLDPTQGIRLTAGVTPYLAGLGSTVGMTVARASVSGYWSLDADARTVLAARLGVGAIWGAELNEIPANRRFYAGGGGSVRGFAYRSLSPQIGDDPIGGRSLVEASVEARIKITDVIGVVPFFDAGTAFRSSGFGDFEEIRYAAGIGVRYYTGIGPIRVDIAFPLDRRPGEDNFAFYVGFGQAF